MIELNREKRHEAVVRENLERDQSIRPLFDGFEVLQGPSYPGDSLDAVYRLRNVQTLEEYKIIDRRHIPRGPLQLADVQRQISSHR
jgi:hypothetical protein